VSLGSPFGIRIRVHPSWLVIFVLVVASLATWLEGPGPRGLTFVPSLLVAIVVAIVFFASVVAHELAHALVARRFGIEVREIGLFLFGGAAAMAEEPRTARSEALIAGAGPVVSGVVGLVFVAAALALDGWSGEGARVAYWMAYWLGVSNLLLAGFNLIPGFPMDGGRILRAIAWGVLGDYVRGTRVATWLGRVVGWALVFLGFLMAIEGNVLGGLWLVLIGWFLGRAAQGAYNQVRLEQLVQGLRVADAMDRDPPVVAPTLTLDTLMGQDELQDAPGLYPVVRDGALVGSIDVARMGRVPEREWPTTRVADVMATGDRLTTLTESRPLMDAVSLLEATGAEGYPVVDEADATRLVGTVTRAGVLRVMRSRAARLGGRAPSTGPAGR
jgi:Zn-dependent protease/CBS domain-containing protein